MAQEIILLDTDFLIEYLYKNPQAVETLESLNAFFLVVGCTTIAELIKGAKNKEEQQKLAKQVKAFHIIHIDEEISEIALQIIVKYHLSHNAALSDSLLAATAIKYGCKLATCNTKHFSYIPKLVLLNHNVKPKRKIS